MPKKYEYVELDFTNEELVELAILAHEEDITLNQLCNKLLMRGLGSLMKKKYKVALLYEAQRLQQVNKLEDLGLNLFDDNCWGDYVIFYIVLDELGIPKDKNYPRDDYNNVYYNIWSEPNKITMDTIDELINDCIEIHMNGIEEE